MASVGTRARTTPRIPGVEGLRALAATAIVLLHVWSIPATASSVMGTAWLSVLAEPLNDGVTLFFVLSGFLLWRPFASAIMSGRDRPSLRRYARNRLLRILPAYWTVLLISALVLQSVRIVPLADHPIDAALRDPTLLLKDALLVQNLAPSTLSSGLVPAWSLAVEIAFYALVPLLALLAASLTTASASRRRRLVAALAPAALLLAVGLISKLVATFVVPGPEAAFDDTWHSVLDRSFLTHADLFSAGMLVALLRVELEQGRFVLTERTRMGLNRVVLYSPPFLVLGFLLVPRYLYEPLVALIFAALLAQVVLCSANRPSPLGRLLDRQPFVGIGVISYSVFLWSFPATVFLMQHGLLLRGSGPWQLAANSAVVVPVLGALSSLTYLLVERPALKLRRPVRRQPIPAKAGILATEGGPLRRS
jgi:peptidoglycan/LPS O-acetylase OafA/YrhL